jgi:hypothetical protein
LIDKLLDPDTEDVFDGVARGSRLCVTGVEHGLGNFNPASPDGRKVAPEPVLDSACATIISEVVTLPLQEVVSVARIILGIDELDG